MKTSLPRGYFGIGVEGIKTPANVAPLWRTAHAFGAAFMFCIGSRYKRHSADTSNATKHIPLFEYATADEFLRALPRGTSLYGIEILETAIPLNRFQHSERAVYILGAEDRGLSDEVMAECDEIISIPSPNPLCINVAIAGSILMYDRVTKLKKEQGEV